MTPGFGDRLAARVSRVGSIACVGIDPRVEWLPIAIRPETPEEASPEQLASAVLEYGRALIAAAEARAAAIKLQIAWFEVLGAPGLAAYATLAREASRAGLIVIGDVKRGDIGATAEAYARAHLDGRLATDAVTVSPWLGEDGVRPFVERAARTGRGVFVLVRTSNPSSRDLQEQETAAGPLYLRAAAICRRLGDPLVGASGLSAVGAVCGATFPDSVARVRAALPCSWLLLPGWGTQGGGPDAVRAALRPDGMGAIVTASRSVGYPWREVEAPPDVGWRDQLANAVSRFVESVK